MAVFELSSLPKLRRVGLVRVNSLTDEAIYALGERHATLERIHLSYCNHITIMSIHFLLQKLPKLTHLSLTGIPAFRRPELQRFCRPPPPVWHALFAGTLLSSFIAVGVQLKSAGCILRVLWQGCSRPSGVLDVLVRGHYREPPEWGQPPRVRGV
jgi:hypothetical protein